MFRLVLCSLVIAACGSSTPEADPFPTMQACFDEHHITESLSSHDAIVVCCLDHPINGVHPSCKDTAADCESYLMSDPIGMLSASSATAAEIMQACTDYITQKGM